MSKRKLLLADDSITIQKVVNLTFADEGIEVVAVGDGDSAMQKINESLPDLILADVNMPGLSGYEICEQIKQNAETKAIPVILLVGSFEPFDEAKAERIGADDYLTKPFQSIRQLVNKVTDLLEAKAAPVAVSTGENEDDNSWQYADTKEMPPEEMSAAHYGDAAMDDEMIDAERFGGDSETETAPQEAETAELPQSFIETAEEKEEVSYSFAETGEEIPQAESETRDAEETNSFSPPEDEVRETDFAIVSDETDEDEFQKELPSLDETEETAAFATAQTEDAETYTETDHFSEEAEEPRYAETAETSEYSTVETAETSESVYEFADTENDSEKTDEAEAVSENRQFYGEPEEYPRAAAETETVELERVYDEAETAGEETSRETEDVENAGISANDADTSVETSLETEDYPQESPSAETERETESPVEDDYEETVSESEESAEEPEEKMQVSSDARMDETAETGRILAEEDSSSSENESLLDVDEDFLELPPLVTSAPAVASAPQASFVSETQPEVKPETVETAPEIEQAVAEPAPTEPTTESVIREQIIEATGTTDMSPEMIEAIAQKVAEKLSDRAIREIAWEVVPQMTELIIKKMAEENEGKK